MPSLDGGMQRGCKRKKGKMKELGHIYSISIVPVINTLATSTSMKVQMNECGTIH